jgi:hypothetical protein
LTTERLFGTVTTLAQFPVRLSTRRPDLGGLQRSRRRHRRGGGHRPTLNRFAMSALTRMNDLGTLGVRVEEGVAH